MTLAVFGQADSFDKIKALYDKGQYKETIELSSKEITKLKTTDPLYKKMTWLRVDCYMGLSDFKSAIKDYNSLISLDSKDASLYVGLSYAYWSIGDDLNCFKSIDKAYAINPKDAGTLSNMSYYYGQAGKYDESIKYSTIGLEQKKLQNTLKGSLLNNRGYAYIKLKQYDKALADINQSIIFHPDNSYAYCYRALANIGLKKLETVCKDLDKSKSLGGVTLTKDLIEKHCKN